MILGFVVQQRFNCRSWCLGLRVAPGFINHFFSHWHVAKRASVLGSQPVFNTLFVERVLSVARKNRNLVFFNKVFEANNAVSVLVFIFDQISKLGNGKVLHEIVFKRSVVALLLPSHVEVKARDSDAGDARVETALEHSHVPYPEHHPHGSIFMVLPRTAFF